MVQINSGTEDLLAEIRNRVAIITLNRPKARNALSKPMSTALGKLVRRFDEEPEVGSIVITGAGTAFCAGDDVKRMAKDATPNEPTFDQRVADLRVSQRAVWGELFAVRKPTLAAIPGPAAGAGLALALACDMRIAAQSSFLITAYARVALSGDCGIAWLLTKLVGFSRARELMLLSERIDARRAEALGLVNRVVSNLDLRDATLELAESLARGPTFAFRCIKNNLDHATATGLLESMDYEAENEIRTELSSDHKEGVSAFAEKRKPAFEGR